MGDIYRLGCVLIWRDRKMHFKKFFLFVTKYEKSKSNLQEDIKEGTF